MTYMSPVIFIWELTSCLLQWPSSFQPITSRTTETSDRRSYPSSLNRLLTTKQWARKSIKDFAASIVAKQDRIKLLRSLEAFGKPERTALGSNLFELLGPGETQQEQDDYQAYIRALYTVLSAHCLCQRQDARREITANLRLNSCGRAEDDQDGVTFSLFFPDHPHQEDTNASCQWQDT